MNDDPVNVFPVVAPLLVVLGRLGSLELTDSPFRLFRIVDVNTFDGYFYQSNSSISFSTFAFIRSLFASSRRNSFSYSSMSPLFK